MKITKRYAYETNGAEHVFKVFPTIIKISGSKAYGSAPYMIFLDGAFLATAETGLEVGEEIEDTIRWFGWSRKNPDCFA